MEMYRFNTELMRAAARGDVGKVSLLANRRTVSQINESRQTAAHFAADLPDAACLRILLDAKSNLEARDDRYGMTLLGWAAHSGSSACVRELLARGADPLVDQGSQCWLAVDLAIASSDLLSVHMLGKATQWSHSRAVRTTVAAAAATPPSWALRSLSTLVGECGLDPFEDDSVALDGRSNTAHHAVGPENSIFPTLVRSSAPKQGEDALPDACFDYLVDIGADPVSLGECGAVSDVVTLHPVPDTYQKSLMRQLRAATQDLVGIRMPTDSNGMRLGLPSAVTGAVLQYI